MRCLRCILDIKWLDKVTNNEVFARTGLSRLYTLLQQCRLRWLGHVSRMPDGRIPKDLLYGELASGSRVQGRPHLRFKDACKRDMKAIEPDPTTGSWWPQTETSGGRSCIQQEAHRKPSTSALAVRSARLHALLSHQHSSAPTVTETVSPESGSTAIPGAVLRYKLTPSSLITLAWRTSMVFRDRGIANQSQQRILG